jgi:hypothetical protein
MANAGGRLLGTLLSGVIFELYGFVGFLLASAALVVTAVFCLSTCRVRERSRLRSS